MEPTPPPKRRDYSGRVYPDRECRECGSSFTPSNAVQRTCLDCRPKPEPAAICAAEGCEQPLRKDNRTGYCTPHKRAKNRGEIPERDYSGRVYKDRTCPDCGTAFTPASATQQRCPDCRPKRKRALKRKQDWDICSIPGCGARLRASNKVGRCQEHRYIPVDGPVCAVDGCGKPLRRDNQSGYCRHHKFAKGREPVRYCGAPGCKRTLRTDNNTGYCGDHVLPMWKDPGYLGRRYAKERAERARERARRHAPRICSVDDCARELRSDNTTGRCVDHAYIPLDLAVCAVDGCDKRLRSDNAIGRCTEHRGLYWADDAPKCSVPGCGKTLHADNKSGLCKPHYDEAWKRHNARAYYARNAVALREYAREYREVYGDEHRESARTWNVANPEARQAMHARRRQRILADMDDIDRLLSALYRCAIRNDPCYYCGSATTDHVDHYFPLAKGGTDHWWNLVRACRVCNLRKNAFMCGTAFLLRSGG